jgi:hypothetical protein
MKKIVLLLILISLSIVQSVSGFSISSLKIDPSGDLSAGTPVTITFILSTENPADNNFVITTDLKDPVWSWSIRFYGDNPQKAVNGDTLTISGYLVSYGSSGNAVFPIELKGTVPSKPSAKKNLLKIEETDSKGDVIAYPPGYNLPMPVKSTPKPTHTVEDTIIDTPTITGTMIQIENTETEAPISAGTVNVAPKETAAPRFTEWPSNTPTPASPLGIEAGSVAIIVVALLVMRRK